MTKLSRLLSVLLGDENILAEAEEIIPPEQTMEDSESDKDVDIMDLDEPAKEAEITNGETDGHSSMEADDANGILQINGTDPTNTTDQPHTEDVTQPMETEEHSESTLPQISTSLPAETQPTNGTAPASATATPSRSPTPLAVTRPTTRLQTAAITRPHIVDTDFTWPSSLIQPTPGTSAADLGLTPTEASEVRRMVQAALERSQEFLRCLEKVRLALVRADKQRKMVWLWCKDSAKLVAEQEQEDQ